MGARLERGRDGRMILKRGRARDGRLDRRVLAVGLAIALVAISATGIQAAIAAGDKCQNNIQMTYGEEGYYEENNNNTFPDDDFPGLDTQNRTGVGD